MARTACIACRSGSRPVRPGEECELCLRHAVSLLRPAARRRQACPATSSTSTASPPSSAPAAVVAPPSVRNVELAPPTSSATASCSLPSQAPALFRAHDGCKSRPATASSAVAARYTSVPTETFAPTATPRPSASAQVEERVEATPTATEPRPRCTTGDDLLDLVEDAMAPRPVLELERTRATAVRTGGAAGKPRARPSAAHAWARPGSEYFG